MSDFSRTPGGNELFVNSNESTLDLILRFREDFAIYFDKNPDNDIKFNQLMEAFRKEPYLCYFQKQKVFQSRDKITGKTTNLSNHKIIIPFEAEMAFEGILIPADDGVSYRVHSLKQVFYISAPQKDTIPQKCNIKFQGMKSWDSISINSEAFRLLLQNIEQLNIPTIDLNKERDRSIWKNYVVALKRITKRKEKVWKIKKVDPVKYEVRGNEVRAPYINIYIDENQLANEFKEEVLELFNEEELEDYAFGDERVSIEFKNFRRLSQSELEKLTESGAELFYELAPNTPYNEIGGEVSFIYSDFKKKDAIFQQIINLLKSDYQLEIDISTNGFLSMNNSDLPFIEKIISDYYSNLLRIEVENRTRLKVEFSTADSLKDYVQPLKKLLVEEQLGSVNVVVSDNIILEIPKAIQLKKFKALGLDLVQSENKLQPANTFNLKPIEGYVIKDNCYVIYDNINPNPKDALEELTKKIEAIYPGKRIYRKPTKLYFKANTKVDINVLRHFKLAADKPGKSSFNIETSILEIQAHTEADYLDTLKHIRNSFSNATIEEKPFKLNYYLRFKTDSIELREETFNRIRNEIRSCISGNIRFDSIKDHNRLIFNYRFNTEEERDNFKTKLHELTSSMQDILALKFENLLGRTNYELIKNEKLEEAEEKKTNRNVFNAEFVFLTPDENITLRNAIESHGELASFSGGISIGKLVDKKKNKLEFRLNEEFDDLLNAPLEQRLDPKDIVKGFIKPHFQGELSNINRMIKAMEKVVNPGGRSEHFLYKNSGVPVKIGFPINKNLPNFLFDPTESRFDTSNFEEQKNWIIQNLNQPLIKDVPKQLEAVTKTLLAKDLSIIQGPPGTGKTTVISEIVWQTLVQNPSARILITSQTHLAVDNALERTKGQKLVRPIRIGETDKFEDEGKVYSRDRLLKWLDSKVGSSQEKEYENNAVYHWIESIIHKSDKSEEFRKPIEKWTSALSKKDSNIKQIFYEAYSRNINVFAATCSECGSPKFSTSFKDAFYPSTSEWIEPEFDMVIMDESSKATPPELILPLTLGKKVVIIGDHKQLPPMIDEREFGEALEISGAKELIAHWTRTDYKTSQFEKLFKNAPREIVTSLDTQFRMHEQIMDCISQFYEDQTELENGLICGIKQQMDIPDLNSKPSRYHGININPLITPETHAIWVNVDKPETQENEHYYSNDFEVETIYKILKILTADPKFKELNEFMKTQKEEEQEIGIITFYGPQRKKIGQRLYPTLKPIHWKEFDKYKFENEFNIPFRINTVDKFQGMEKNIVIVSTVRSNKQIQIDSSGRRTERPNTNYPKAYGFAQEHPRINVGFSRAKRLLIVVGNEAHFSNKEEYRTSISRMHRVDFSQIQNLIAK